MTPQAAAEASAAGAVRALGKTGKVKPLKIEGPVTLKVRYQFAERAADATTTKVADHKTMIAYGGATYQVLVNLTAII